MLIDSREQEISIGFNFIEQLTYVQMNKTVRITYFVPQYDFLGDQKKEMKRKSDEFECAEYKNLLKVFNAIR